ncbi:hypothetical protein [uncultured Tenacibaculum sp.]|uniref:hypothetical protein n=1 Tax=uncultured Tenacibaculum sp. TaxID=174713 RepID=UPI002628D483|nr:hypothetical protein [uncultured Tenacibaculum sp.]
MKKLFLVVFVVSLAFVSCTDNTNEDIQQLETQSIDKENSTHPTNGGEDDNTNEEG